jgi:endonuclease/exonuclease/phosphatase family metal-dependent hydrolase
MNPGANPAFTVVTYNIHKGFSAFNRRLVVHEIRERLHALSADVVFLQEVQGLHRRHSRRHHAWPEEAQHEFLAEEGGHSAYGMNAAYQDGHHGNAIVSRFPIVKSDNVDISHHALESRGLLHCELEVPGWKAPLHCINVHLGLWGRSRRLQIEWLCQRIREAVPASAPLVVAGDFNDWRGDATMVLSRELGLEEVFHQSLGHHARSFPARLPILSLDRIYVRDLLVGSAQRLAGGPWSRLSDHAALSARLMR